MPILGSEVQNLSLGYPLADGACLYPNLHAANLQMQIRLPYLTKGEIMSSDRYRTTANRRRRKEKEGGEEKVKGISRV